MATPRALYPLQQDITSEFSGPDLPGAPAFDSASALAYRFGALGVQGGDGFDTGYELTAKGAVLGIFEIDSNQPGVLISQHDGSQGVIVKIEGQKLTLQVDGTTATAAGIVGTSVPRRLSVTWNDEETLLVEDGIIVAKVSAAPTLPAQNIIIFAGAAGTGAAGTVTYLAIYDVFLGPQQPYDEQQLALYSFYEYNSGFPGDADYNNVKLLIRGSSFPNEDSPAGSVISNSGTVAVSEPSRFATPSLDASGGPCTIGTPATELVEWSNNDTTIEAWVYRTASVPGGGGSSSPTLIGNMSAFGASFFWSFGLVGDTVRFNYSNGAVVSLQSTAVVPVDQWSHIAVTQTAGTIQLFVNGQQDASATVAGSPAFDLATTGIAIGQYDNINGGYYYDQLRVTNGIRYTGNFEVPSDVFPNFAPSAGKGTGDEFFPFDGDYTNNGEVAAGTWSNTNPSFTDGPSATVQAYEVTTNNQNRIEVIDFDNDFFISVLCYIPSGDLPSSQNAAPWVSDYNGSEGMVFPTFNVTGESDETQATIGLMYGWSENSANTVNSGVSTPIDTWFEFAVQRSNYQGADTITLFLDGTPIAQRSTEGRQFNTPTGSADSNLYLGTVLWVSQFNIGFRYANFRYFAEAIADEDIGYQPSSIYLPKGTTEGDPIVLPTEVGDGVAITPVANARGGAVINAFGNIGYNPQSDDQAFRAPVSWGVRPYAFDNPTDSPLMFDNVQDTWDSKKQHIHGGTVVMADMVYGPVPRRFHNARGVITGSLVDEFSAPVSRLVRAKDRTTGHTVKEQWADASGNYGFYDLDVNRKYTIVAHDYTGTYNAVVKDDVTPIADESE